MSDEFLFVVVFTGGEAAREKGSLDVWSKPNVTHEPDKTLGLGLDVSVLMINLI